jgi:hypothetical protein
MKRQANVLLALVLVMLATAVALAAGDYDLSWWTVASGGGTLTSQSPGYSLSGTLGQPLAGPLAGGSYQMQGGFWVGHEPSSPGRHELYLPLVTR